MITPDFRKKMADSWFSYLQIQICKEFEYLENNKVKFIKRDWNNPKGWANPENFNKYRW